MSSKSEIEILKARVENEIITMGSTIRELSLFVEELKKKTDLLVKERDELKSGLCAAREVLSCKPEDMYYVMTRPSPEDRKLLELIFKDCEPPMWF